MNILTIMGTPHKGNTRAVVDLFLKEFEGKSNWFRYPPNKFDFIFLWYNKHKKRS